jgi:hypothetical protein
MRLRLSALLIAAGALTLGQPMNSHAQQPGDADGPGWRFVVAPYLLFPYMDGTVTVRAFDISVDANPNSGRCSTWRRITGPGESRWMGYT